MTYYDNIAKGYNRLHKEEQLKKLKIIRDNLIIEKTDKLLDVGCGTGFSKEFFDCKWYGFEPSRKMAKQGLDITIGYSEQIPFQDNYFDIVISVTAIHNFYDIKKGLLEIKRVGKNKFGLTVLKKAEKYDYIKNTIEDLFYVNKLITEDKDTIFICSSVDNETH